MQAWGTGRAKSEQTSCSHSYATSIFWDLLGCLESSDPFRFQSHPGAVHRKVGGTATVKGAKQGELGNSLLTSGVRLRICRHMRLEGTSMSPSSPYYLLRS